MSLKQRLEALAKPDWRRGNLTGYCPVQCEGMIGDKHYYFRARGNRWSFGVGATEDEATDGKLFYHTEPWGDSMFAAGWMPEEDAWQLIERCVGLYVEKQARP